MHTLKMHTHKHKPAHAHTSGQAYEHTHTWLRHGLCLYCVQVTEILLGHDVEPERAASMLPRSSGGKSIILQLTRRELKSNPEANEHLHPVHDPNLPTVGKLLLL